MLKISNVKIYGLEESIVASGYPMLSKPYTDEEFENKVEEVGSRLNNSIITDDLSWADGRIATAENLGSTGLGEGHDNFLKGIIVQYDVRYPVYWSPQFQRYSGYNNIISSQSAMHRLTKMNLNESFNEYVVLEIKEKLKNMIKIYNEALEKCVKTVTKQTLTDRIESGKIIETVFFINDEKLRNRIEPNVEVINKEIPVEDLYMYIISNCPQGLEKTMRVSTNYLQLKTMYSQRKKHKLKDWKIFCEWCLSLPYFKELTGCE